MQVLLGGVSGNCRAVAAKLLALLLLAGLGTVLALGCYIAGVWLETGEKFSVDLMIFLVKCVFVLLGTQLTTYVIHLFLSLKWQKGITIGAGIVESMLCSLVSHNDGRWNLDVLSVCMGDAASEIYDIL